MRFDDGEKMVTIIRKHWIMLVAAAFMIAVGIVFPFVLLNILPSGLFSGLSSAAAGPTVAFVYFLWLLFLWLALFTFWTNFYLNIWIITDRRIIDIVQRGLFSRELITARLEKVQDVTVDTEGILATVIGYGTIHIHTADEKADIIITNATHPNEAREKILSAHAALLERSMQPAGE